jgi:hypothetical protein
MTTNASLSPSTIAGLWHRQREAVVAKSKTKEAPRHVYVTRYECPQCYEQYDDEGEAAECCAGDSNEGGEENACCPVCGSDCLEPTAAASCCLWKDLDQPARERIAAAVYASPGKSWPEAIAAITGHPEVIAPELRINSRTV